MVTKLNFELLEARDTPSTLGELTVPGPDRVALGMPDADFEYGYEYGEGTGIGWAHGEYTAPGEEVTPPRTQGEFLAPAAKSIFVQSGEAPWGIAPLEGPTTATVPTTTPANTPTATTYFLTDSGNTEEPWFDHIWVG